LKIAIVKLSAMGDIIHSMVALQFIKKHLPNSEIDWIIEGGFSPILENNPDISNILQVNLKAIKRDKLKIFQEIRKIKKFAKNNYDVVIDVQGLIKSAIVSGLLGKNRWGFSKNSIREKIACNFYKNFVNIDYTANTIDRNSKMLSAPLGFEISQEEILNKKPFLFFESHSISNLISSIISKTEKNIIFVIGSTWESRNYPREKFAKIANNLKENIIIVWGNEDEKNDALWIKKNSQFAKVMGKIDLNSLKALIAKSDLVIGNDTGPTHLAWGFNIPSITIFGPTPINRIYITNINKAVKSNSIINHFKLDKNDFSIRNIDEEKIIKIAKKLLYFS